MSSVEPPGIEPGSESHSFGSSTCVVDKTASTLFPERGRLGSTKSHSSHPNRLGLHRFGLSSGNYAARLQLASNSLRRSGARGRENEIGVVVRRYTSGCWSKRHFPNRLHANPNLFPPSKPIRPLKSRYSLAETENQLTMSRSQTKKQRLVDPPRIELGHEHLERAEGHRQKRGGASPIPDILTVPTSPYLRGHLLQPTHALHVAGGTRLTLNHL